MLANKFTVMFFGVFLCIIGTGEVHRGTQRFDKSTQISYGLIYPHSIFRHKLINYCRELSSNWIGNYWLNYDIRIKTIDLRILTGKKHPKIKLQQLRKIRIWKFGSLVHQINSFQEVLKLKQIFQKNKAVTGKTPLFVIGQFCGRHSICLNTGFRQSNFECKWCVFNLSGFN